MTAVRKGINNTPGPGEIKNLGDLCYAVLEPATCTFRQSIRLLQDFVVKRYVKLSGAKRPSQHALGQAADFEIHLVLPNIQVSLLAKITWTLIN